MSGPRVRTRPTPLAAKDCDSDVAQAMSEPPAPEVHSGVGGKP